MFSVTFNLLMILDFDNGIEIEIVYFYSHHMKLTGIDFRTQNA